MAAWDILRATTGRRGAPLCLLACLLAGAEAPAAGQVIKPPVHIVHRQAIERFGSIAGSTERVRFEPWAGALFDAYRNEGGNDRPAWIGAARFAYELGAPIMTPGTSWRVYAEIARAEAAEAGTATLQDSLLVGFRTEWWLGTAGIEWDVWSGWMGLTLEGGGGAAWIQREIVGGDSIPPGTPGTDERAESDPFGAIVLGASGYRHLTHRVQLRVRVSDVVTDPFDAFEHSPAIGLGLRFVFE